MNEQDVRALVREAIERHLQIPYILRSEDAANQKKDKLNHDT